MKAPSHSSSAICSAPGARQHARCPARPQSVTRRHELRNMIAPSSARQSAAAHSRRRAAAFQCRAAAPEIAEAAAPDAQAALARLLVERRARMQAAIPAGPPDAPPSYESIDAQPHNRLFMHMFRQAVVDSLGEDAPEPGWVERG